MRASRFVLEVNSARLDFLNEENVKSDPSLTSLLFSPTQSAL